MNRNNNPASRIISRMREEGTKNNGFDMTMASVISVNPIGISYNNTKISTGVVLSGCLQTETLLEEIIENEAGLSQGFKNALNEILLSVKLSEGDSVIVQRVKDRFYIIGKVNS